MAHMSKFLEIELLKPASWLSFNITDRTLRVKPKTMEKCWFKFEFEWTLCKPPDNFMKTPINIKLVDWFDPKLKRPINWKDPCLKIEREYDLFNLTAVSY
jgi:hypothetical protein